VRIPGLKTVKSGARWVRARLVGRGLILGYHRIAADEWDPFDLCVSPQNFEQQLEVLRARAHPLPLSRMVEGLATGELPPRAVAVTFDDGYLDNLEAALPRLLAAEVPATVFSITGLAGKESWWDELARLLEPGGDEPVSARRRLVQGMGRELMRRDPAARRGVLDDLSQKLDSSSAAPRHRAMNAEQLSRLSAHASIEIGSHTITHPWLNEIAATDAREEILESKRQLERQLDRTVDAFSYPNGAAPREVQRMVREAGYRYACTSPPDTLHRRTDPWLLPRFWAADQDGDAFADWLRPWLR